MMLFLGIVFGVFLLAFLIIMSSSDVDGWNELRYHNGNWKRFLQDHELMRKDMEYAIHMRDIYAPNKRLALEIKDKERVITRTNDYIYDAIIKGKNVIKFDLHCDVMTREQGRDFALEITREIGYKNAKLFERGAHCYDVAIELGPKS